MAGAEVRDRGRNQREKASQRVTVGTEPNWRWVGQSQKRKGSGAKGGRARRDSLGLDAGPETVQSDSRTLGAGGRGSAEGLGQ